MSASEKEAKFFGRASIGGSAACWLWTGARSGSGYGYITMRRNKRKWNLLAHRLAKELAIGRSLAKDENLHHVCEEPLCVNPRHLEIVSRSDHRRQHMREWGWNVSE